MDLWGVMACSLGVNMRSFQRTFLASQILEVVLNGTIRSSCKSGRLLGDIYMSSVPCRPSTAAL